MGGAAITLSNIYFLKTSTINSNIDTTLANYYNETSYSSSKHVFNMMGYFASMETQSFTYTNDTSETSGYEGTLLQKLNKWVTDNQTADNRYSTWKMSTGDNPHPIFSWQN